MFGLRGTMQLKLKSCSVISLESIPDSKTNQSLDIKKQHYLEWRLDVDSTLEIELI